MVLQCPRTNSDMTHKLITTLRIAAVALLLTVAFGATAQVERGQKSFGPKVGYITKSSSVLAGLTFDYAFSRHVRIAPALGIAFRNKERDALLNDIDMHFPFATSAKADFYPLAGVAYNSWGLHDVDPETFDDVTSHQNSFGLNAGAGWEIRLSGALRLGFEAKYTLIRHNPNGQFAARIAYVF